MYVPSMHVRNDVASFELYALNVQDGVRACTYILSRMNGWIRRTLALAETTHRSGFHALQAGLESSLVRPPAMAPPQLHIRQAIHMYIVMKDIRNDVSHHHSVHSHSIAA
jgi:hypothetical protein